MSATNCIVFLKMKLIIVDNCKDTLKCNRNFLDAIHNMKYLITTIYLILI